MGIRIAYALAVVLAIGVYLFTGATLALGLALALLVLAVLMIAGVVASRAATRVSVHLPSSFSVGAPAFITLRLEAGPPIPLSFFAFDITCSSLTFGTAERSRAHAALGWLTRRSMEIPIDTRHYGRMRVSVEACACEDALGFSRLKLPFSFTGDCIAYPQQLPLAVAVQQMPLSRAFGATFDTTRSGSDVDEVFDVREFQAGDHMASVHWKLSSKFDELMSREFSRPVDFELVVVCLNCLADPTGEPLDLELLNGTASVAQALTLDLFQQGYQHNFAIPANDVLMDVAVEGTEAMDATTELLLSAPLARDYGEALGCIGGANLAADFTKCILITPVYDDGLFGSLAHDMDLTVVQVAQGVATTSQQGEFEVVTIDVAEAGEHEHCITV